MCKSCDQETAEQIAKKIEKDIFEKLKKIRSNGHECIGITIELKAHVKKENEEEKLFTEPTSFREMLNGLTNIQEHIKKYYNKN